MFVLRFQIGDASFAVESRRIVEVVPMVNLGAVAKISSNVVGLMQFRGETIPVVDLTRLLSGRPSRALLSTRILVVQPGSTEARGGKLGLIAERVNDLIEVPESAVDEPWKGVAGEPYLDRVLRVNGSLVQMLRVDGILATNPVAPAELMGEPS